MSGRPPTPPNDEEMADPNRPIGAGAGPAPAAEGDRAADKAYVIGIIRKIKNIPYENTIESIKNAVKELVDDEKLKKFVPGAHDEFEQEIKDLYANDPPAEKLKEGIKNAALDLLGNVAMTANKNKQLGIGFNEAFGIGGKRRKTRKSKKSRKHRKTSRRHK